MHMNSGYNGASRWIRAPESSSDASVQQSVSLSPGPKFLALLTAKFCAYDHHPSLICKCRVCTSCVSVECLVMLSLQAHMP